MRGSTLFNQKELFHETTHRYIMCVYFIVEIVVLWIKLWMSFLESFYRLFISRSPKNISGQVVLITGGGHGIGRALAIEFASRGAKVVLWDINKVNNDSTANEIKNTGGSAWAFVCDVTKSDNVHQVAEQVRRDVGEVDILVNNAGILNGLDLMRLEEAQIRRCMEVNTMSHFWTLREFMPKMMEKDHGHIVCIASMAGQGGVANLVDYCASKFAVVGMMEAVTDEIYKLRKTGVYTSTVCPLFVNTGMTWFPRHRFDRVLEPGEVATRIIEDVLRNERIIFIPRRQWLATVAQKVLPQKFIRTVMDFCDIGIDPQVKDNKTD